MLLKVLIRGQEAGDEILDRLSLGELVDPVIDAGCVERAAEIMLVIVLATVTFASQTSSDATSHVGPLGAGVELSDPIRFARGVGRTSENIHVHLVDPGQIRSAGMLEVFLRANEAGFEPLV